ncbi:MAG: S9 family peptidase [Caldisericia bacterium]|nr:S9 family peptidase [Caldisericia bacterium]
MRKLVLSLFAFALALSGCGEIRLTEKDVPLWPRQEILGSVGGPPIISPKSYRVAYRQTNNDVLNVWVKGLNDEDRPKCVTNSKDRPIINFYWDYTDNILYSKDANGDENYHIYRVDLDNEKEVDLTPGKGFKATLIGMSPKHPDEIVIMINDRNPELFDVKKINLLNAKTELLYKNVDNVIDIILDSELRIRAGTRTRTDGGLEILKRTNDKWEVTEKLSFEDAELTYNIGINQSDRYLYMVSSSDRNTSAFYKIDLLTWEKQVIAEDSKSDVFDYLFMSSTGDIAAVVFNYDKKSWNVVDPSVKSDLDYLSGFKDADFKINSMSLSDKYWIITYNSDIESDYYYLYDRESKKIKPLYSNRYQLKKDHLARMYPRVVQSRDGLDLVCYLSLPPWTDSDQNGVPEKPIPMVLYVHGGPQSREYWSYNSIHQLLANRGYAVLSVNFRGSSGFGKDFLNKGNGQWGVKMQDDLIDAVDWAISEKIADPKKVAIFGGSYGGYASLVGMTFTPEKFACGIDLVGISNLETFLKSTPTYWKPYYEMKKKQIGGDPDTEEGRKYLASKSPISFVENIRKPLLIAHGLNDPRVKIAESEQIVNAMQQRNIPVVYCLFPDEGHGFGKWQNSFAFYAIVENFLAKNLGGRYEAFWYDSFDGSSIQVKAGEELFEGLDRLLPKPKPSKR